MQGPPSRLSRRGVLIVAVAAALVLTLAAIHLPLLGSLELRLLDWRLRAPHPSPPVDNLLIVGIESSTFASELAKWGPSALDRGEFAPVIRNLHRHGAKLIALDVHFGDAGASPKADTALAQAIAEAGNVILVADAKPTLGADGSETIEFTPPADQMVQAARSVASPLLFRPDNVVRWVKPLQHGSGGVRYCALSFEVLLNIRETTVVQAGPVTVNWAGPEGTVERVKFEDLRFDRVASSRIADRIVFIGVTEEQKDLFATPVGPMSGVEIHAQAAATMLAGMPVVATSHTTSLLAAIALCGVLAVLAVGRRSWHTLLLTAGLLSVWTAGCYLLFRARGTDVPMTGTIFSVLVCGVALSVLQSERVVTALSRLWPAWVSAEGEEIEATVLVCDMAGYTARSEQAPPGEMMELMKRFFALVDEVVDPWGGVLARRPGDAAIVFFRAERNRQHHAQRALQAALGLRDRLAQTWGGTDLDFGITLTTGAVSLGFVGTSPPEPQILGDPVNVGFRLQSETRRLGEAIIADWPTATADPETARLMRPLGQVQVRNRRAPVQLFTPTR